MTLKSIETQSDLVVRRLLYSGILSRGFYVDRIPGKVAWLLEERQS